MKLTERDRKLLRYLRTNSRASLTEISKHTKIPISTLFDRLKAQQGPLIKKHTTLVDFTELGYHTRVQFLLKVPRDQKDMVRKHLEFHDHVNSLYKLAHDYDFCVEGVFEHVGDVEAFITHITTNFTVEDYKTYYLVEDIKREGFFSQT